jgi:protocatechuate 3,4-dioxygenase beta subunit
MGYFELRGLVPGEHTLVAHTRHEVGTASPVWLGLDDVAARITVRMTQPLAPLHARVVDADTGEAVPHCQIGLGPAGDERRVLPSWFHTDGRGRLDIELVPGARVVEGLSCPGHAARPPYPAIEVGDPIPAELQWEVDRGVGFRGRLVDAHGNPAAGRWVSLSADDPALSDLTFFIADPSIQTASDGTFEVPGLRPGRYRLYAGQDSTLGPIHVQVPVTEELTTIRLPPTGRLEAAVPGARDRLYLHAIACPLRSPYASMDPFEDPPSPPSSSAFTRSGRVVFEAIAPGRYALSHERRESACELDGRTVVVSVAADRTTMTTLHVPASVAASRTISGTVLGPSGEPHRGAFVELLERGSIVAPKQDDPLDWTGFTNPRTVTDEAGRFAFSSRAPGEYVVRAHARGLQGHAAADAREGDGTVALTLR